MHRSHRLVAHLRLRSVSLSSARRGAWIAVSGAARDGSTRVCDESVPPVRRLAPLCARWSSRTCTRRPSGRRPARSCATRSRRCGGAGTSRSSCSPSRPARATTRGRRASCGGATAASAFDVVHVHFGLVAWPALLAGLHPLVVTLHGNDLLHPRSRPVTLARAPVHGPARGGLARVQRERARRGPDAARRDPPLRRRPHALPADPARARRASGSGSTPTAPTSCSRTTRRGRSSASTARRRRRATSGCSRSAACRRRRCRTGSTPPTRSSCRRRTRAWGSR